MAEHRDQHPKDAPVDDERRAFLRRSVYAAYATPLITALLVEEAGAARSGNNGAGSDKFCKKHPWHQSCR
jgi:hypothetical protein